MMNHGSHFYVNLHENVSPSAKLSVISYEKSKVSQKFQEVTMSVRFYSSRGEKKYGMKEELYCAQD